MEIELLPGEDMFDLEHVEHGLPDVGVDGPLDFDGRLRNDVQQASHVVADCPPTDGGLPLVAVVFPRLARAGGLSWRVEWSTCRPTSKPAVSNGTVTSGEIEALGNNGLAENQLIDKAHPYIFIFVSAEWTEQLKFE